MNPALAVTLVWSAVSIAALVVILRISKLISERVPVSPEPMKSIAELRSSTQKALDLIGSHADAQAKIVAELQMKLERLSTHVSGKGDLIVPKPEPIRPRESGFPGPQVTR